MNIRVEMREVGAWESGEIVVVGTVPVVGARLRDRDGAVHPGVISTMIDNVAGFASGLAVLPEGWVVTTNLSMRSAEAHLHCDGALQVTGRIRRKGQRAVVADAVVTDLGRDGVTIAEGTLTSAVLVPEFGVPVWDRPARIDISEPDDDVNFYDWVGARPVSDHTLEVDLRDALRNPWGILHGGIISVLVDAAGAHAAGRGRRTADVMLHFLAPGRVGPVLATATLIGERADGQVARIEIRDQGADGRLMAFAITTLR